VDQWLGVRTSLPTAPAIPSPSAVPVAPPLRSFTELEPPPASQPKADNSKPIAFVCEDDVRTAIQSNSKILVGRKTIITPSARDIGDANDVFVVQN
jgi:acetaldehyde dehydrogenase (acetylating)